MLEFQELTVKEGARLRPYYETCDYRLCEYSLGVKLMWRDYLHPWFTEAAGCLIIRNCIEGQYVFDYPILGPEGDAGAALAAIEQYCGDKELPLVLSVVPEDKASQLVLRYPRVTVISERPWKDYLYHTEDLAQFAGRRYSGQRNHINKFRRDYPDAAFVVLTDPNDPRLTAFWADYEAEFHKTGPLAKQELTLAQEMFSLLDTGWFCAGGMLAEGRLVAVSLAEKCGGTLVNHIEKALYSHAGAQRSSRRGGFEQGCRIAPEYAGHGYGTEAFAAAADWALYHLGLQRVVAKCFKENEASRRMLSSCMRPNGEDDTYYYFEKLV